MPYNIRGDNPLQPQIAIQVVVSETLSKLGLAVMANLPFRYKGGGVLTTSTFLQNKFSMAMSPDPVCKASLAGLARSFNNHYAGYGSGDMSIPNLF